MSLFHPQATIERANEFCKGTMLEALDITFTEIGEDYLVATMPVNAKVHQPMGLLHGGASAALAESVGSSASAMCIDLSKQSCVGISITANHVKGKRDGVVTATARNLHLGRTTHIWDIDIRDEEGALICDCRLTMLIRDL